MASKTFLTISKEECLNAYKEVLINSERKWDTARRHAEREDYGGAIFMAITSVEELVKSAIILMDGHGFDLRKVNGMGVVFRNHQIRYLVSYGMFVINVAAEEVRDLLLKARENPQESNRWISAVLNNDQGTLEKVQEYALKKFELISKEFDWFDQLHIFRQDSLYCDYREYLKNPLEISADNYSETISRLAKVRLVGLALVETLNSNEELYVKHYENMKRMFVEKKFYENIGCSLARLKHTRDTPFQVVRKYFMSNGDPSSSA